MTRVSDDVSDAMRAVAQLAAEAFTPDDDTGSQHIVNHFNGHRILKRLISNDTERMKHNQETGKSCTSLIFSDDDNINPSTGSSILLHQREAGVILTPRILWCILLVLSGVLNANQLISHRRNANSIILLHPSGDIAIRHVCLFVRLCVRKHVLGRNILKTAGDSHSVTMEHL